MAPGIEWITNFLQAVRPFNLQAGLVYFGSGTAVTAFNYLTRSDPNGQYFEDKAWPIIAIIGLVVTLVDLGRMGLEALRMKAAERAARADERRKAEAAALASQAEEAKLAETVVETMWAIEELYVKRVLKYILTKPNRRFTAWSTNVFMDDLVAKRIVRRSHVEDGISSKGTYLVHPAI